MSSFLRPYQRFLTLCSFHFVFVTGLGHNLPHIPNQFYYPEALQRPRNSALNRNIVAPAKKKKGRKIRRWEIEPTERRTYNLRPQRVYPKYLQEDIYYESETDPDFIPEGNLEELVRVLPPPRPKSLRLRRAAAGPQIDPHSLGKRASLIIIFLFLLLTTVSAIVCV